MILLIVRKSILLVGVTLLFSSASATAEAAILTAIEDNHVLKSAATTVQASNGSSTTVDLKAALTNQGNARLGYFKFDLEFIAQSIANEGKFTITSTGVNSTGSYGLRVYALKSGDPNYIWSESLITYDNRPAYNNLTNPLVDLTKVTQAGTDFSVPTNTAAGTSYSFSFANLENYRQTDDTLTFIAIVTTQTDNSPSYSFASSEHGTIAFRPTLEVTAIPEPSTLALLGFGIAGGILWRRRK